MHWHPNRGLADPETFYTYRKFLVDLDLPIDLTAFMNSNLDLFQ